MANNLPALTIFSGAGVSLKPADMAASLRQTSQGALDGDGVYMSFSGKMNKYSVGKENAEVDPADYWLVNVADIQVGYVCWKGGQAVAKRLKSAYSPSELVVDFNQHGPFNPAKGEGWFELHQISLKNLNSGLQAAFNTNSKSGVNEFRKLERAIAEKLEAENPAIYPVVQLGRDKFTAQGQVNYKPVINVVHWMTAEEVQSLASVPQDAWVDALHNMMEGAYVTDSGAFGSEGEEAIDDVFGVDDEEPPAPPAPPVAKPAAAAKPAASNQLNRPRPPRPGQ